MSNNIDPVPGRTARPLTFCNPLDLPYRFALRDWHLSNGASSREGADPTMVVHKGEYWLFVSKSGWYWRSRDLLHWDFIEPTGFPIEDYAPTVLVIGEKWVLTASDGRAFYACDDPATGKWVKVRDFDRCSDPALLLDDDGRLYMYWGASWDKSIEGIELDPRNNFEPISKPQALIPRADPLHHGWEAMTLTATDDEIKNAQAQPWTEGAWINKHKGVYYLEYAAPPQRVHAHGLRHTFAAGLADEKIDIRIIQRALGHSSLGTTARYVDHLQPTAVIDALKARTW